MPFLHHNHNKDFGKNAKSVKVVMVWIFIPHSVLICVATIGVCVFSALASVDALFYFTENFMTVAFLDDDNNLYDEEKLSSAVIHLIENQQADRFYMTACNLKTISLLKTLKRKYPHIDYFIFDVNPEPDEVNTKNKVFLYGYEGISKETIFKKINRWFTENADIVIISKPLQDLIFNYKKLNKKIVIRV